MSNQHASEQLSALEELTRLFEKESLDYWLFGGWAVDFYIGSITRRHDDIDVAVWLSDFPRIAELLLSHAWRHVPQDSQAAGTDYERGRVRLELTCLVRDDDGLIHAPSRTESVVWLEHGLADDIGELLGIRSRLVALTTMIRGKSMPRADPDQAAKDRTDYRLLTEFRASDGHAG
jgi:hypothetical protein